MDINIWLTAIGSIGFPSALALYLLFKSDRDKKDHQTNIDKKDEQNREFTKQLVSKLEKDVEIVKIEAKEDKAMFKAAITSFERSVDEFRRIGEDIGYIKVEIKDIKTDISNIKK